MKERSEPEIRDAVFRPLSPSGLMRYRRMIQRAFLQLPILIAWASSSFLLRFEEEFGVSIDFVTVDPASLLSISGLTGHLLTLAAMSNRS